MEEDNNTNKSISQPPLDILFNPSLISKKDVWEIDVVKLLEMLLKIINLTGKKDLRVCGIAALSSALIYRLKVESIFRLEKIAMMRKGIESSKEDKPVPLLRPIEVPYRIESTYPVSLEDLLHVLENMIMDLATTRKTRKQLNLDAIQSFDFNDYLVKFEQILQSYEDMIFDIVSADKFLNFRKLTEKMDKIETVRCFIAVLYLALRGKITI